MRTGDLTPVEWADLKADKVEVGEWVATCGPAAMEEEDPVAVGVVSVGRRRIPGRLRISRRGDGRDALTVRGVKLRQVIPGSAAEKAGVKVGDVISAVMEKR